MPNWSINNVIRMPLLIMALTESFIVFTSLYFAGLFTVRALASGPGPHGLLWMPGSYHSIRRTPKTEAVVADLWGEPGPESGAGVLPRQVMPRSAPRHPFLPGTGSLRISFRCQLMASPSRSSSVAR